MGTSPIDLHAALTRVKWEDMLLGVAIGILIFVTHCSD